MNRWPHLHDITLPSIGESEVRLIIGSNAPDAFWVLEERRGQRGEPYAVRCPLGWTVIGPADRIESMSRRHSVNFTRLTEFIEEDDDYLMQQLAQFWKIESYGRFTNSEVQLWKDRQRW